MIYVYPLQWPAGYDRTASPGYGGFKVDIEKADRELAQELERLGASSAYLSTDYELRMDGRPRRDRPAKSEAATLHFVRNGQELMIPCDRFNSLRDNIRAIGLSLAAIRSMERYGTSQMMDRALSGFAALPASASGGTAMVVEQPWHEILGVDASAPREVIDAAYKAMRKKTHPDMPGGSVEDFNRVTQAYKDAAL